MKKPSKLPDFQDSTLLREATQNLRRLVSDAAARLKQARGDSQAARIGRGFGKGNGQREHSSRY